MRNFPKFSTIVIKIGSSSLTSDKKIDPIKIQRFVDLIAKLQNEEKKVVLVTSGAVASAAIACDPKGIRVKQALASVGQVNLMAIYKTLFEKKSIPVGQILVSEFSLKHRESYLNAKITFSTLFEMGVLPIVNENDPLATEELKFGDNDQLGALISGLVDADYYVMLSDVDGFYLDYGKPEQKLLSEIQKVDSSLFKEAGGSGSHVGTGGMVSKLKAASLACSFGIPSLLHNSNYKTGDELYKAIFETGTGSLFLPSPRQMKNRKKWIASGLNLKGSITVDEGAEKALRKGKSLLPAGIKGVDGQFSMGDVVAVKNLAGIVIAKGLVNYPHEDLGAIGGLKTAQIEKMLGAAQYIEAIHADNLVIL